MTSPLSSAPTVQRLPHYLGGRSRPCRDCPSPAAARSQGQLLRQGNNILTDVHHLLVFNHTEDVGLVSGMSLFIIPPS